MNFLIYVCGPKSGFVFEKWVGVDVMGIQDLFCQFLLNVSENFYNIFIAVSVGKYYFLHILGTV